MPFYLCTIKAHWGCSTAEDLSCNTLNPGELTAQLHSIQSPTTPFHPESHSWQAGARWHQTSSQDYKCAPFSPTSHGLGTWNPWKRCDPQLLMGAPACSPPKGAWHLWTESPWLLLRHSKKQLNFSPHTDLVRLWGWKIPCSFPLNSNCPFMLMCVDFTCFALVI